jgi:hypothetical protein
VAAAAAPRSDLLPSEISSALYRTTSLYSVTLLSLSIVDDFVADAPRIYSGELWCGSHHDQHFGGCASKADSRTMLNIYKTCGRNFHIRL